MLMCTALICEYASSPASPNSRPIPLCLTPASRISWALLVQYQKDLPPNGTLGSQSWLLLTQTMPASISAATR